jgi:hypothetical protein
MGVNEIPHIITRCSIVHWALKIADEEVFITQNNLRMVVILPHFSIHDKEITVQVNYLLATDGWEGSPTVTGADN